MVTTTMMMTLVLLQALPRRLKGYKRHDTIRNTSRIFGRYLYISLKNTVFLI